MKEPKVSDLKKYLNALLKIKKKFVNAEILSKSVGIYPEIISECLSYFEPTLLLDSDFNLLALVPTIKKYIDAKEEAKQPIIRSEAITRQQISEYESIGDFIYRKMTVSGLLNKSAKLSDKDLRVLKKLIAEEQNRRKRK